MERAEGGDADGALAEEGRPDSPRAPPSTISTAEAMGSQEPPEAVSLGAESALATSDSGGAGDPAGRGGRGRGSSGRGRGRGSAGRGRGRGPPGRGRGPSAGGRGRGPPERGRGPSAGGRGRARGPLVPMGGGGGLEGPEVPGSARGLAVPGGLQGPAVLGQARGPAVFGRARGLVIPGGLQGPAITGVYRTRARGSRRRPSGVRSVEKSMEAMSLMQDESQDIEEQFILRLPPEHAYTVRKMIHSRGASMKDKLKVDFSSDGRNAVVQVEDVSLSAKLVNLPCVIESMKTVDRKTLYKTADISQMLVCSSDSEPHPSPEEPVASTDPPVTGKGEGKTQKKKYNWKHGITPPLKNVRKKRFRKTAKKCTESPNVEKEMKRLLCSDAEAISVRWEVIADDETKEIESQGCISGISGTPQMSGPPSSDYDMLREMFGDSRSNSNDVEDKADKIEAEEEDEGEESDDDDDDDDDEEDEEEEEKKIDSWEAELERELQAKFIQSSSEEENKDYDYSSIITGIQKLIYYKEKKLQQVYKKAQRQKDLLRNVENLTLKRHFQYVLEQLNILEKQKCEEIYHLQEQLKCFLKE
ncbi:transcription initiation factor TFIID subunit 7-like isoform X2 [Peromyscus maniculatus bairdii]|uniref:transcription initiation factor TFIID subunit 7-like isoform X2 n=1 Tax=Peromyscus maniculatus bairdii TaxID=230844 RepID=UPI001C2E66E6|nr:transcription initiation factor TFIID subunit 7-like isoform X2 [Peromyscus maniculatus bairdii]